MSAGLFSEPRSFPGQDPFVFVHDGWVLLLQSAAGNRRIVVRRFRSFDRMHDFEETVVWAPDRRSDHGRQIWAPEVHEVGGRWYLYYAASDGRTRNHRMYVLEGDSPYGPFTDAGKIADPAHDVWAIDFTLLHHRGGLYGIWSSWEDARAGSPQNLYIAPLRDPCTLASERQLISRPEHGWELTAAAVNEGPEVLRNPDGRLFVVYSADASWTHAYKLGLLEWNGGEITDPISWAKLPWPIFTGGGHASFVDVGGTHYAVYHRKTSGDPGWFDREIKAEPYTWDAAGYPHIGRVDAVVAAKTRRVHQRPASVGFPSASETGKSASFSAQQADRLDRGRRRRSDEVDADD